MSHSHKDLIVWEKAKALAGDIYRTSESFPRQETYGLTSQLRRAAVSVASNIAEGQGRITKGEFQQFLGHSRGSLLELETQLEIAVDLGYVSVAEFKKLELEMAEVSRLLNGLIDSLHGKSKPQAPDRKLETRNLKLETLLQPC